MYQFSQYKKPSCDLEKEKVKDHLNLVVKFNETENTLKQENQS